VTTCFGLYHQLRTVSSILVYKSQQDAHVTEFIFV